MDKYEVIGTLGEGCFGRVYKAKQTSDGTFVALKVISKRGRSTKELKGFRRECEIQRDLNHPNIIQMLDSFETENEIVVITEFAHKELAAILGKGGYLPEEKVQPIVWDLVSALYYLHSNRVLHRDLKPQNILLDQKNRAKLCDFGFARNMSTGTHVLTSIKGTPLYMAPELIAEQPYDYSADLWSLGCIIYELLMGAPPFCTSSILHLIRLIRHEHIQWPTFLSEDCTGFLKGLLQKNPTKRFTWDDILNHPFIKGHILITKGSTNMPLTKPLSASAMQVKEQQRKDSINKKCSDQRAPENVENVEQRKSGSSKHSKVSQKSDRKSNLSDHMEKLSLENKSSKKSSEKKSIEKIKSTDDNQKSENSENSKISIEKSNKSLKDKLNFIEDNHPIETDEWIVFLQKTIQEVINGELSSLLQPNLANVIVTPLRNSNINSKVLGFVARLFSVPFVIKGTNEDTLFKLKKVYLEVKLIPNLIYATKLFLREHRDESPSCISPSPTNITISPSPNLEISYKILDDLSIEDYQAIEYIYLLIVHLVYTSNDFLLQFCDSVVVLNVYVLMKLFLLMTKRRLRITLDLIAILTEILRKFPEHSDLVESILLHESGHPDIKKLNFVELLRHSSALLRERTCYFLMHMGKSCQKGTMDVFWNDTVKETIEALMFDSIETVRNAAEASVGELKNKEFYSRTG